MAKASKPSSARKSSGRAAAKPARGEQARRRGDTAREARPAPRVVARKKDDAAVTRVTHETEVRGTETRVERVVERAPKPSLPDVDRAAGRGRYVYCIIRASQPLKFGAIGMDEQWPDV